MSPALAGGFFTTELQLEPWNYLFLVKKNVLYCYWTVWQGISVVAQMVKRLLAMRETEVRSLG